MKIKANIGNPTVTSSIAQEVEQMVCCVTPKVHLGLPAGMAEKSAQFTRLGGSVYLPLGAFSAGEH